MKKFTLTALALWIIVGTARSVRAQDDHGNTRETAPPIRLNSTVHGTIQAGRPGDYSTTFDSDYFRVEIPRCGRLTVHLSRVTQGLEHLPSSSLNRPVPGEIAVDLDCESIVSDVSQQPGRQVKKIRPGTCYIYVIVNTSWSQAGPLNKPGHYTLHVEFVADDPQPEPEPNDPAVPDMPGCCGRNDIGDSLATAHNLGNVETWETDEANEATFWRTFILQAIEEDCEKDLDVYRFTVSQRATFFVGNTRVTFPEIEMRSIDRSYQLYDSTGSPSPVRGRTCVH